jgi:signal transduction histidine kinase
MRIENITKSLLQFGSQLNPARLQKKEYIDVNQLIDESLDVFVTRLNKNIRLKKHYNKRLPAIADIGLQHVFINIIKNALDAMPNGGKLEITTDIIKSAIVVIFKDTGTGIPLEFMEHIFEPFFTTKGAEQGSGLGLSICKEIIDNYGGKIEVQSCPGEGSKFIISIPQTK